MYSQEIPALTADMAAQFWERVDKADGPSSCWKLVANKTSENYGRFRIGGKTYRAHRVSYQVTYGLIPAGMLVCHKCDNPGCVNPQHLFLGTQGDNMLDCHKKGRNPKDGENNGRAKLNRFQASEIRHAYLVGGLTQEEIASKYGVNRMQVSMIARGKHWRDESMSPPTSHLGRRHSYGKRKIGMREAQKIRSEYVPHIVTQKMLAEQYRVSSGEVGRILRNEVWLVPR